MTRENDQIIGQNIRIRRQLLNMNQSALAGVLKTTCEEIEKFEQGAEPLSVDQIFTLARFFNCSIDALCGFQPIDESFVVSIVSAAEILERELPEDFVPIKEGLEDCARNAYKSLKVFALAVNIAQQKLEPRKFYH